MFLVFLIIALIWKSVVLITTLRTRLFGQFAFTLQTEVVSATKLVIAIIQAYRTLVIGSFTIRCFTVDS